MESVVLEQDKMYIPQKPFNNVSEYKSYKKNKKSRKKKRPENSLALMLAREKANKSIKKVSRKLDISKERDSLVADMTKYQQYIVGRIINLNMLKNMLNENESSEKSKEDLKEINELLKIYQKNSQEIKTSIDICGRLRDDLTTDDALEAITHLSVEITEIMQSTGELEERVSNLIEPYKDRLREYTINIFSKSMNVAQAEDILDVDNNAEEDNTTANNEEYRNGSETEAEETEEPAGV